MLPAFASSDCSGSLKFLTTSDVDEETVELLLNETTVASGNECAQLCFDLKCGVSLAFVDFLYAVCRIPSLQFAHYKPAEKLCRFSMNTEEVVDASTCDVSARHYKSTIAEDEPVQITCVSCEAAEETTTVLPAKGECKEQRSSFALAP